jgi:hypothetical protein
MSAARSSSSASKIADSLRNAQDWDAAKEGVYNKSTAGS